MFFDALENKIGNSKLNDLYYETFNNNREQGYVLKIYSNENNLYVWACECRNSDDIMIVLGNENECDINNMFSDNVYKDAKYFNSLDKAVNFVHKSLTYYFKDSFITDYGMEFLMNYSLEQIKRIYEDAENLDYEDYHDLAFIKSNNSEYFADLVIIDGKFGLRYSKYINDEEYDNLVFEECELDLSSPTTLLVGMKERLDDFTEKELEHEVSMGI